MRFLIVSFLTLLTISVYGQTVWVADNNFNAPSGANVKLTIQAAVDAASPGDIIQIQPSPTTYGSVSIDIPNLTLMGIGFNVNKDIPLTSNMGSITLTNNLSNTSDADGTIIKGLNFTLLSPGLNTGPSYLLENILIQNCQLQYIYTPTSYSSIDGLEVRDCYITSNITSSSGIYFSRPATNVIIRNNLLLFGIAFVSTTPGSNIITNNIIYDGIYVNAGSANTKILNNNFIGATATENAFNTELQNCEVSNNIFYGSTPSIATGGSTSALFQNNTFSNNLIFSTGDNTIPPTGGPGNIDGGGNGIGDPSFVNAELLNIWSSAYDFTLQVGSPAIGMGNDFSDIGITGGLYPWSDINFVLKTTAVPVIQILNTSTVINPGTDLPVRIKANSN